MKYQRIQLKDGGIRYRAQPRDPVTKKRLNVEAGTLEELRQRLERIKQTADELRWGGLSPQQAAERIKPALRTGPLTVAALYRDYLRTLPQKSRRLADENWRFRLNKHFSNLLPHSLTRDVMAAWQQDMIAAGYAPKTILNSYNHLAGCMRTGIDKGVLDDLPWGTLSKYSGGTGWRPNPGESRKNQQFVGSVEQACALIMTAKSHDERHWKNGRYSCYAVAVGVFMLTGLRQAELCALGWDCLTIDNPPYMLRVIAQAQRAWHRSGASRPNEPTKTKKQRAQALHPTVVSLLRLHRAELRRRGWYRPDGPVFPGVAGKWRTSGRVIIPEKMKAFARESGFPHWEQWVTHSLRHSFATLEVKSSGDLKRTQARTGHADLRQLEGYLHATGAFLGTTAIPELPLRLDPVQTLPDGTAIVPADPGLVDADPWGIEQVEKPANIAEVTYQKAVEWDRAKHEAAKALRAGSERKFSDIAVEWVQNPDHSTSGIPKEVATAVHRNYCAAYAKEKRAGGTKAQCQRAANFKARACKGAWARAVAIAEKKLAAAIPVEAYPMPVTE